MPHDASLVDLVVSPGHAVVEAKKVAREICALPADAVAISRKLLKLPTEELIRRIDRENHFFGERMRSPSLPSDCRHPIRRRAGASRRSAASDAIPGGLKFVPFSFTLHAATGMNAMDAEKEQEIIRLWNRLRRLEREGRPAEAIRRQIEKALAERDRHAA